jgi:hypothetical protein
MPPLIEKEWRAVYVRFAKDSSGRTSPQRSARHNLPPRLPTYPSFEESTAVWKRGSAARYRRRGSWQNDRGGALEFGCVLSLSPICSRTNACVDYNSDNMLLSSICLSTTVASTSLLHFCPLPSNTSTPLQQQQHDQRNNNSQQQRQTPPRQILPKRLWRTTPTIRHPSRLPTSLHSPRLLLQLPRRIGARVGREYQIDLQTLCHAVFRVCGGFARE